MKRKPEKNRIIFSELWFAISALMAAGVLIHREHGLEEVILLAAVPVAAVMIAKVLRRLFPLRGRKVLHSAAATFTAAAVALPLLSGLAYAEFSRWEQKNLSAPEIARPEIFSDRNVLVISPHPDDEILLVGGVVEQYTAAGSKVTLAYVSDGGAFGKGEQRRRETAELAKLYGTQEIRFLGLRDGDNSEELLTASLEKLLEEILPDTVFCVVPEDQIVHFQTAVAFETVLERALEDHPGWQPEAYLGSAYASWMAEDDFLPGAVASSKLSSRNRFPVTAASVSVLSPALSGTDKALRCHRSQDAVLRTGRVMRSDRAFVRGTPDTPTPAFFKLTLPDGTFAYELLTDETGVCVLKGFVFGEGECATDYRVSNPGATVTVSGDEIAVACPSGQGCYVEALNAEGTVLDAVAVFHPRSGQRWLLMHADAMVSLRHDAQVDYLRSLWHKLTMY